MKKLALIFGAALLCLGLCACGGNSSSSDDNAQPGVAPVESSESADAVHDGSMEVTINLTQSVTSPEAQDSALQFSEEETTVVVPDGSSVISALMATDREIQTEGIGDTEKVTSIGGLANGDAGEGSHWEYSVNGEIQATSPGTYALEPGDTVTFNFVD